MTRHRYISKPTTIWVERDVAEQLKKLRRHKGEPLGEVIRRLLKEHHASRAREVVGY
jgi:predicted CopG family antitoxin